MSSELRIILTREKDRNQIWADRLQQAALPFSTLPLVQYESLALPDNRDFSDFGWIMFTSPQGVRAFADLRPEIGMARCAVLGHGTAAALEAAGWKPELNAGALDGVELAARFLTVSGKPCAVLLPGPKRRLTEPRAALEAAGYTVQELPLYETLPVEAAAVAAAVLQPDDVIFFCSPSAVRAFAGARDDKPRCVAIGRTTAEACRNAGFTPAVAGTPDLEAMVRAAGISGLSEPTTQPVKPEMES
ncbi:MAG: uroporphyrinogen-III synthase [Candidatus Krumholzibacteria bacterium]|nr:uroporphyrinogen-III synthase [Candidatus Krumholzibacteria bacterium]